MKKYVFALFALMLLAGNSCQEKIDIEKEKAAIIAVLEEETNAAYDRDFDRLAATWIQDETSIWLGTGKSGYMYGVGWKKNSSYFKEYLENNPEPSTAKFENTNYRIKVYKESAWAIYDQVIYNSEGEVTGEEISVRFLEKVDGEWKIVYLSFVSTLSYDEEIEEGEVEAETEETE